MEAKPLKIVLDDMVTPTFLIPSERDLPPKVVELVETLISSVYEAARAPRRSPPSPAAIEYRVALATEARDRLLDFLERAVGIEKEVFYGILP